MPRFNIGQRVHAVEELVTDSDTHIPADTCGKVQTFVDLSTDTNTGAVWYRVKFDNGAASVVHESEIADGCPA